MDVHLLALFFVTQILLALTPGPDWMYVMARGIAGGKRSALVSVCGVCSGYLAYAVLVALGLAALLRSSDVAFEAVRYAGAAYLLYLGVRMLLSKGSGFGLGDDGDGGAKSDFVVLRQGFMTAFLNPKGLVLFFSLLPQFVAPSAALPVAGQLLVLGLVHTFNCFVIYGAVGLGAGHLGEVLKRRPCHAPILPFHWRYRCPSNAAVSGRGERLRASGPLDCAVGRLLRRRRCRHGTHRGRWRRRA